MRVTNTMISENAMTYIGANKVSVDANNTRMTTQKKIDRPSEDPVIAVRSLRLQTSLDKINQFYEKNIPDAESWMDVTETALLNIKDIMTDVRTLCVQGATDTLTEDDRKTIYTQLKSLQEQLFKEGNADYAGRTVFTGFRTNKDLVFSKDEAKTSYSGIQQPFNAVDMELTRYYTNKVTIPTNRDEVLQLDAAGSGKVSEEMTIQESDYYKLDLAYNLPNEEKDAVTGMHFYDVVTENGKDMWIEQGEITFDTEKRTITGTDPVRSYTMTDLTVTPDKPEQPEYTGMEKPTMPVLPENATDAQKEQYQQDLAKYQSDMVQYKAEYAQYEKQVADYYEKLDNYNSNVMARKYVTDKFGSNLTKIYEFESEADWAAWSKLQQVETAVTDENGDPVMEPVYEDDGVTQKLDEDGNPIYRQVTEMKAMDRKYVPDDAIVIIKDIGDVLSGEKAAVSMMDERAHLSFDYDKTGFLNGELKPEYYFDCTYMTDSYGVEQGKVDAAGERHGLFYDRYDKSVRTDEDGTKHDVLVKKASYSIDYTISQNQTLGVNFEADQCFNHDLYQDMYDMIDAVSAAQLAHEKVEKLQSMMKEDQYQTDEYQEKLKDWLELARKEMDYYDNNMSKLYSTTLGKCDVYLDKINLSITDLGCRMDRCKLTENRINEQQETVEELQSKNDDMDLSEILMRYTSSYTAYQSSLVAAGKLGDVTLLNYI